MGLISISPVRRFLDAASADYVQDGVRVLLSSFLEAMHTQTVYVQSGLSPRIRGIAEAAGVPLPAAVGETDPHGGSPTIDELPVEVSIDACAYRMADLPKLPGISGGVSFGLDRPPVSPATSWKLWLHRGPLPLIELELSDRDGFRPSSDWQESVLGRNAAHVLADGNHYVGSASHLYLLLKRRVLFPYSKGDSSDQAMAAGRHLHQLCQGVWLKRGPGRSGPFKLAYGRGREKDFVRRFDEILISEIGSEEFARILQAMGTSFEPWLDAVG